MSESGRTKVAIIGSYRRTSYLVNELDLCNEPGTARFSEHEPA